MYHLLKRLLLLFLFVAPCFAGAQTSKKVQTVPKPLYRDPVYDGAADPVVIWNKAEKNGLCFTPTVGPMRKAWTA